MAMAGTDTKNLTGVALIGFGEAARTFVDGWRAAGLDVAPVRAFDVKTGAADSAVAEAKRAEYAAAGVDGRDALGDALDGARLVLSLVTADQARIAAEAAAPHLCGTLYLDGNSCAPGTKQAAAKAVEAAGGRYVDMAIMAPVAPKRHLTPLLVSGPHAEAAMSALAGLNMAPAPAPGDAAGRVGGASAIKMVRSVMMKGLEALFAECVLAGRVAGVDDVVMESLDRTYPGFDFKAKAAYMLERTTTHGIRRAAEMTEVAATVRELGLPSRMAEATVDWELELGSLGVRAGEGEDYGALADAVLAARKSREGGR